MGNIAGNQHNNNRHPRDDYPTDPAWVRVLLNHVELPDAVWEPAAGNGAMVNELSKTKAVIGTCITSGLNFLSAEKPDMVRSIVTNPPYRLTSEFICKGLEHKPDVLAMLVGLHYLGGISRCDEIFIPTPPSLLLLIPERMKVNGASSQFNHCWLVWEKGKQTTTTAWGHAK
jgi:hypothetical protein